MKLGAITRLPLEMRAMSFADNAHRGQVRKYTGEPYICHPYEVTLILRVFSAIQPTETQLAAAWLHDVVEDTPCSIHEIIAEFGVEVGDLVAMLTDVSPIIIPRASRRERKLLDCQHLANASPAAKTIKLADLISNTASIVRYDPKFAVTYLNEKAAALDVLHEGDSLLWLKAGTMIGSEIRQLER